MCDNTTTNNINTKKFEDKDQDQSDEFEEKTQTVFVKSEKRKTKPSTFGRPRKHPYKPGKYKCSYCDALCSKPSVLTKHMRAHTNERPFPCGVCKRSFKTKSNLSKHEKSKSHSSKVGENYIIGRINQSKKEKINMMLQALSGIPNFSNLNTSIRKMEFDSLSKKPAIIESGNSSPTSSEEKSVISDDICMNDVKKELVSEQIPENVSEISEITESASSCSGVLTINSQGGPITVEVQINLETMRHLQQGLSQMTYKKSSPSSPILPMTSRNDAEMRAAESILHMANQRTHSETITSKEDNRKNGTTSRNKLSDSSPLSTKSPESNNIIKAISNNSLKPSSNCESSSSKSTPMDEVNPVNFKIQTKCLVKENLLKKMKRKQVQETNTTLSSSSSELANITTTLFGGGIRPNNLMFSSSNIRNENFFKTLITDSKSSTVLSIKPKKGYTKSQLLSTNSHLLNTTNTCCPPTIVLYNPTNNHLSRTITPEPKITTTIGSIVSYPESSQLNFSMTKGKIDIDTAILSKVITNTQSLHQHQGTLLSNSDNLSVTNSIISSRVAVSSTCLDSNEHITNTCTTKENQIVDNKQEIVKDENMANVDESNSTPNLISFHKQTSSHTTQESETESSPRLCIVEEPIITTYNFDKKSSESDEEIDVVNTDSDDDRLSLQRVAENIYSETAVKIRKLCNSDDVEVVPKDVKRLKENDKCTHLHAPNINAKDLMQDCPLNLSANRQPTIPPISQIPVSVLHNLYQVISSPSSSLSPSANHTNNHSNNNNNNNTNNTSPSDNHILGLTNHNPAHPQSFQNLPSNNSSFTSNGGAGHNHDYPIFEDKMCCDVCSQMIEPSMLTLHKNMHIYTNSKDSHHAHGHNNNLKPGLSTALSNSTSSSPSNSKIPFNKPRSYKCVVCNIAFRVIGHLRKHHKSKTHLQGLVNSGLLSKTLFTKIEQSKVPIQEVIDQKTGNIIPDVLSRYISNWSQPNSEIEPH